MTPAMPPEPPPGARVLTTDRSVAWGECDPAGIIYYPTYYRWMDGATWELFALAGYDAARIRAEGVSIPLVQAECSFVASPTYGDRCTLRAHIERWGGKSFSVAHRISRADGALLAHGSETRVWSRFDSGPGSPLRGQPVPDALKALFRVAA